MAENNEIKGVVSLNADPAVQGFQKVEDAGKKAAQSLEASAKKAADGVSGIGDGAKDASKKIEAETGRISAAIQRQTLALQAGGKATADYYEGIAKQRGANLDTLKPFLDNLRAVEAQQKQANMALLSGNAALGQFGLTAKQTTAALRQVPAQFTDIITSLQGGQAPLTVLLQQGGQLKDVFGGVGNAAQALGGYVLGLVNPFTLAVGAAAGLAFAFEKGAQEQRAFEKTLILTGNAAGVTAGQLSDISARIDKFSGATQGKAAEALNVFAIAGIKGASSLERFTATAIEFERAGGGALETVAENFAKLGKDPLKASLALNDSINFLTRSLYEQIKGLEDQGKATEAAKVAQEAYNSALQDRTPQLVQNLGLIERGWNAIKDATKGAYDAALNVGRAQTPSERLDAARRNLAFDQKAGPSIYGSDRIGDFTKNIEAQKSLIYGLEEIGRLEARSLTNKQQQAAEVKALAEYDKLKDQYLDKQVQKEREIAKARELARQAGKELDPSVLEGINKKFDEKPKDPTSEPAYKEALRVAKLRQELRIKENEEIDKFIRETENKQEESFRKLKEAADEAANKAFSGQYDESQKTIASLKEQIDKEKDAAAAIGLTKDAIAELEAARLDELAAAKDRLALSKLERNESEALYETYKEEADSLRALAQAKRERGAKAAEFDELKKYNEELKRTAEQLNSSLTDALLRGFESGKGFAENFRDTLKNMFKTLVLKPVISVALSPISQSLSSLYSGVGKFGSVPGVAGIAPSGSLLSGIGSLLPSGVASSFGTFGSGVSAGFSAALGESGFGGAFSAAGTALGAGNIAGGIGTALGALGAAMPYIGAAVALYNVFKEKKTPHLGSAVNTTLLGTATTDRTDYLAGNYNAETDKALRFLALGSVGSLNKLDTLFGGAGGFTANAKFAADNKDASAADATIFRGGREVSALAGEGYKLYAPNSEEAFKAFTKDFEGLTLQAIKGLEKLPTYVKSEFDKLGDSATTEGIAALVDQIGLFQGQLEKMKLAIDSLGSVSDEALASIIANAGGIQQFSSAIDAYYANFYTDTERLAFSTSQLSAQFQQLGVAMPTTRDGFRALVESLDTTTTSGQKLYADLLNLSGSFAAIVPAAEEAKQAISGIVQSAVQSAAAAFAPLPSQYGSYVQDGVTYIVGNAADLQAEAAARTAKSLGSVTSALGDASAAFAGVADAIGNEIKRIKGEITGGSANGQAASLAQFATLTAQARAGGLDALKDLPSASQAYLSLVKENAGSLLEIQRAQGYVIGSLEQTQQTVGLAPISGTAAPSVYQGPSQGMSAPVSFESFLQELRASNERLKKLEALMTATEANTKTAAIALEDANSGKKPFFTEAA